MNPTESTTTVAEGPGHVDYEEWSTFYYSIRKKIASLKEPAKTDIQKMTENAQMAWLRYSTTSLRRRQHDVKTYDEFKELRKMAEKYTTMAIMRGMHY